MTKFLEDFNRIGFRFLVTWFAAWKALEVVTFAYKRIFE